MRLSLRQLQIFRAIALSGSTAAAAMSVPLSQSAASAALKEWSVCWVARLFDRVGKRLLMNDNGRALAAHGARVLDGVQIHRQRLGAQEERGFEILRAVQHRERHGSSARHCRSSTGACRRGRRGAHPAHAPNSFSAALAATGTRERSSPPAAVLPAQAMARKICN